MYKNYTVNFKKKSLNNLKYVMKKKLKDIASFIINYKIKYIFFLIF